MSQLQSRRPTQGRREISSQSQRQGQCWSWLCSKDRVKVQARIKIQVKIRIWVEVKMKIWLSSPRQKLSSSFVVESRWKSECKWKVKSRGWSQGQQKYLLGVKIEINVEVNRISKIGSMLKSKSESKSISEFEFKSKWKFNSRLKSKFKSLTKTASKFEVKFRSKSERNIKMESNVEIKIEVNLISKT
jgi:phosphatidate phosphatase APP1